MDLIQIVSAFLKANLELVTLVGLIITLLLMIQQNRIAKHASDSQNLVDVITFLQEDDTRKSRKHVLTWLKKKPRKDWNKEDFRYADKVCATYDIAGRLMREKYVDSEIFFDGWGSSIRRSHIILAEHLRKRRKQVNERYWSGFDWLFEQVLLWEKKHDLQDKD